MFRISFIFSVIFFTLVSCKKEYTCSCQQTYITTAYTQYGTYYPQSTTSNSFQNTFKDKEDGAIRKCKNIEKLSINTYGTGQAQRTSTETVECVLY
jgi:hypothetical protein